ncbi:MAG: hypothetical protein J6Z01_11835 [Bacteroidales bacterium]|nr:hypothetical protein [Bacteroidales bacterium]
MKLAKYILASTAAILLNACEQTVYLPPEQEPIKPVNINIRSTYLFEPIGNGSVAIPVDIDDIGSVAVAQVHRDGSYTLSDTVLTMNNLSGICINSSNEILLYQYYFGDNGDCYEVHKLNSEGKKVYHSITDYEPLVLLDNGGIACLKRDIIEGQSEECLIMQILENNFTYVMGKDFSGDGACAFDDNIFLYDVFSGDYCIFKTNGTYVNSGSVDHIITNVRYVDGNIYVVSFDSETVDPNKTDTGKYKWEITKMDLSGRQLYSTQLEALSLFNNFTIYNGNLIATGAISKDIKKDEGYGVIFMINDNNGSILETISCDYDGCDFQPLYIYPNKNGEFDVYAVRHSNYETKSGEYNGFSYIEKGKLFIYHLNDLHKLQINN